MSYSSVRPDLTSLWEGVWREQLQLRVKTRWPGSPGSSGCSVSPSLISFRSVSPCCRTVTCEEMLNSRQEKPPPRLYICVTPIQTGCTDVRWLSYMRGNYCTNIFNVQRKMIVQYHYYRINAIIIIKNVNYWRDLINAHFENYRKMR